MIQTLGFIGIGAMGAPIVRNLLRHGHRVVVFDIDRKAIAELEKSGATSATSASELASLAPLVFLCLPSVEAVTASACDSTRGIVNGNQVRTCVNLSTVGPACVEQLATTLAANSIELLDCPITGGAIGARDATLSITVSGAKAVYDEVQPLLACIATRLFYVGERPGQAQLMKLLNNMLSFTAWVASCEAFVLGAKAGLDPETMVEVINTGTGRNSATTDKIPKHVLPRTFDYGAKLAITHKDISLCMAEAERYGVPMRVGDMVKQMIEFAVAQSGNQVDVTTLIKHYEKWAGVEVVGRVQGTASNTASSQQ